MYFQEKGVKRRVNSSSCDELAFKLRRNVGTNETKVTHANNAQPEATTVDFKSRGLEHVEEEQVEESDMVFAVNILFENFS